VLEGYADIGFMFCQKVFCYSIGLATKDKRKGIKNWQMRSKK